MDQLNKTLKEKDDLVAQLRKEASQLISKNLELEEKYELIQLEYEETDEELKQLREKLEL